jgi:endonuclease YncB( thermonuclease family)
MRGKTRDDPHHHLDRDETTDDGALPEGRICHRRNSDLTSRAHVQTISSRFARGARVIEWSKMKGRVLALMAVVAMATTPALGSPIEPGAIEVVDGDTIRAGGRTFGLVGFDTPETGSRARCEHERTLAAAASRRLRQLVAVGGLDLERVACSCRPGTEGTPACNHGRLCGTLSARGQDVGAILISEGLGEAICMRASIVPAATGLVQRPR